MEDAADASRPQRPVAEELTPRARLGRLTALFAAHAMGTANITLVLGLAPILQGQLSISPSTFGWAVACYYAAQTIWALPAGWMVDRFGIRRVLMISHVILAIGMASIATARGLGGLVLGLSLCGFGYALVNPATARGVLAWFDARYRATAMGVKQTGVPIGAVALAALVAIFAEDWRGLAFGLAAAMLLGTAAFAGLPAHGDRAPTATMFRDLRQVLGHGSLNAINVATCLYTAVQGAVLAYFVTFAFHAAGIPAATASLLLALMQGASAVGRIAWGILGDHLPGNGRVTGLLICGAAGAAGLAVLAFSATLPALVALALVLGLTVGGFASLAQTLAVESVEPRLSGAAMGYNMLVTTGGMMAGPALFAAVLDWGSYRWSWILTAACLLTGAALFRASTGPGRRRPGQRSGGNDGSS